VCAPLEQSRFELIAARALGVRARDVPTVALHTGAKLNPLFLHAVLDCAHVCSPTTAQEKLLFRPAAEAVLPTAIDRRSRGGFLPPTIAGSL
jgi:hypothetical protein